MNALLWLWFLYLGSRSRMIAQSLFMLTAYYLPRRRNPKWWLALLCFAGVYVAVNFQDYRGNFTNLSFNLDQLDKK